MTLTLRRMRPGEEGRPYEVLRSAVLGGTLGHYDEAQRKAWAPNRPPEGWVERLGEGQCFVAVVDRLIVGFMSVTPAGHLDLAYVLPECHGSGVGRLLLERVEEEMRLTGVARMTTTATLAAERFFARNGWQVEGEETVERNGQKLRRVRMVKVLELQAGTQAA